MAPGIAIENWGPAGWHFLHTVCYCYPEEPTDDDKHKLHTFIHAFATVLPCKRCRIDFVNYVNKHVTPGAKMFDNRQNMILFGLNVHNYVNRKLRKREYTIQQSNYKYLVENDVFLDTAMKLLKILILFVVIGIIVMRNKKINSFVKHHDRVIFTRIYD
jgi:hypothetical protein